MFVLWIKASVCLRNAMLSQSSGIHRVLCSTSFHYSLCPKPLDYRAELYTQSHTVHTQAIAGEVEYAIQMRERITNIIFHLSSNVISFSLYVDGIWDLKKAILLPNTLSSYKYNIVSVRIVLRCCIICIYSHPDSAVRKALE